MAEGKDLLQVLWSGADVLRGKMDANEYKTYLLGLVFYKYLSDSYLAKVYDLLRDETPDSLAEAQRVYEEVMESDDAEDLLNYTKKQIITNYHSTIAGLTFVIVLLIPCLMLGILGVIIFLFSQYQKRKIRRLSAYEITF